MQISTAIARFCSVAAICLATPALGAAVYSQTPASNVAGSPSDLNFDTDGRQVADDFTLADATTVRSVAWRGFYAALGNSPAFPLSFNVVLYGNGANNLPNTANVLSTTPITFASAGTVTDTGINFFDFDVYEYRANLTPTALAAGTRYWFSIVANTSNDVDDDWHWTYGNASGVSAVRENVTGNGAFEAATDGPLYFVLDNAVVPEPTSLLLFGLGGLLVLRRRVGAIVRVGGAKLRR